MIKYKLLYSDKQFNVIRDYYKYSPSLIINHGAVRSGKTIIDNDLFIAEVLRVYEHGKKYNIDNLQYLLAGASMGNIEKNVLTELRKKYGIKTKLDKFNRFKLFDVYICCVGHDDIGNLSAITGMTAYGAYINEAHLAKEEVFDEILKRVSGDMNFHAITIADANPGAPNHFLKVKYIDKADNKRIYAMQWTLYDNCFLNEDYIKDLENNTPSGVFFDRKILGRWVTADGIVYRDFKKKIHVIEKINLKEGEYITNYFGACDWGYEHKGAIGIFAETNKNRYILMKLLCEKHQLIEWWTAKAKAWSEELIKANKRALPIYCDSARPDNIRSFNDNGIWAVGAKKEIMSGIEQVAKRFKNNSLYILSSCAEDFIKEIYNYVWDEKKGLPVKINDDVMDMLRYGIYSHDKMKGVC